MPLHKTKRLFAVLGLALGLVVPIGAIALASAPTWTLDNGTTQSAWSVGGTNGPAIVNDGGAIAIRGPDGGLTNAQAAAPVGANDLATKHYVDTTGGSYVPPTGTGFSHITSGAQDSAARAVNVSTADVTGTLPIASLAAGAAAQFLVTNSGATAPAWVTMSGGCTTTAAGVLTCSGGGGGITALTGDVTASGSGSVAATVNSLSGANQIPVKPSGGSTALYVGGQVGGLSTGAIYAGGVTPSASNFAMAAFSSGTVLSAPTGGTTSLGINGSDLFSVSAAAGVTSATLIQFGNLLLGTSPDPGVGVGVMALGNAFTAPTSAPSAGASIYATGGRLGVNASGILFPAFVSSPTIGQAASTTGDGNTVQYGAQDAFTGNHNGGVAVLRGGAKTGSGNPGSAFIETNDGSAILETANISSTPVIMGIVGSSEIWELSSGASAYEVPIIISDPLTSLSTAISSHPQGTVNGQAQAYETDYGAGESVSSSSTVVLISYSPGGRYSARAIFTTLCRAITAPAGGSIGDTWTQTNVVAFKGNGASAQVGSITTLDTESDTSMIGTSIIVGSGSFPFTLGVQTVATATVDCQMKSDTMAN